MFDDILNMRMGDGAPGYANATESTNLDMNSESVVSNLEDKVLADRRRDAHKQRKRAVKAEPVFVDSRPDIASELASFARKLDDDKIQYTIRSEIVHQLALDFAKLLRGEETYRYEDPPGNLLDHLCLAQFLKRLEEGAGGLDVLAREVKAREVEFTLMRREIESALLTEQRAGLVTEL